MEHTTETERAYNCGYEAFADGFYKSDNPYPETHQHHNHWLFGYDMAQDDRKEYLDSISPI
ncbi:MAG TPA: hypothetical protein VN922_16705 [Bacteroidia bacterium]|nr:hypothetical protein [Bacteroidia bacterium]